MSLHVFVVHFPLALLLVGAAADVLGAALRNDQLRGWAGVMIMLGSAAALLAFLTGGGALAATLGGPQPDRILIDHHSQWGGAAIWPVVGAGVLRAMWRRRFSGVHGWANLAAALIAAALVIGISISGMAIAHG